MRKARSTIGEFAIYVEQLRARNAELEPIARRAKSLQSTVDDMAREIVELRAALKRRAERPGPRKGASVRRLGRDGRRDADLQTDGAGMAVVDQQGAVT